MYRCRVPSWIVGWLFRPGCMAAVRVRWGYCGRKRGKIHARFMTRRVAFCRRFSWLFIFWHWVFAWHSHSHFLGVLASVAIVAALPGFTTFWLAFFPTHFALLGSLYILRSRFSDSQFSILCFCAMLTSHPHILTSSQPRRHRISSTTTSGISVSMYLYICVSVSAPGPSTALQPNRTEPCVKVNGKYYFLDTLPSGRRRVARSYYISSCSPFCIHCPAELLEFLLSHSRSDCGSQSHGLLLALHQLCLIETDNKSQKRCKREPKSIPKSIPKV